MYSENDILGGNDPYSGSKASVEVIFNTYFKIKAYLNYVLVVLYLFKRRL